MRSRLGARLPKLIDEMHTFAKARNIPVGMVFEFAVRQFYQRVLRRGDVAMDVGAHNGFHLFPMAQLVGRSGKVIAFEPIPDLAAALRQKIKRSGARNISFHEVAIDSHKREACFQYFANQPAYSGLKERPVPFDLHEAGQIEITVKCRTLDSFRPWLRRVSFVKLDIEGGEFNALKSAPEILGKSRPVIVLENGRMQAAEAYGYTKQDFFGLFEAHKYQLQYLSGEPFEPSAWGKNDGCWELVAVPDEKEALKAQLPNACHAAITELSENTPKWSLPLTPVQ